MENKLWSITHQSFQTDRLEYTSSVVKAKTKEEALKKYNDLARKRNKYPYMWNVVDLHAVHALEIIE